MKSILLASALALLPCLPAHCEGLSAEQIIARSRAKSAEQEAVLLSNHEGLEYVVVAARDRKLEGSVVHLRHIMGRDKDQRVFLYYKPGSQKPILRLPFAYDEFSIEECITLKQYYCAQGKIKIAISYRFKSKTPIHTAAKRAIHK